MEKEKISVINEFKKLSFEDQQKRLSKSNNNICWDGIENYTNLSEDQKNQVVLNSRIINETFLRIDSNLRGGSVANRENAIPILFRKGTGANNEVCLNMCSCPASTVAFWVGIGILEIRENKIIPRILSQNQYNKISDNLVKVSINISSLKKVNKNFEYIYVYIGKLEI